MGKILVLAEKPSVGKELARVLGCKKAGGGYIEGDKYIVTWALGHLVTLEDPEHYGDKYKKWSMETLPMLPEKMSLKVIPETAKQYGVVKRLLQDKSIDSLVIATDAGREGELVARWILEKANFHKPIKRLWISSQTDKAIKEGFARLEDGKKYLNLYHSAQSRAEADWLVGLNVTRALTCKYNAQLSAGRVQTPTLALIVRREEEIKKFIPKDYYLVRADLGGFFVTYRNAQGQTGIFDKAKAQEICEKIKKEKFIVKDVKITPKKVQPPLLYDLTELQRDANKQYQMSPKETLSAMQQLYEKHKALTYPRTDSRYLTEDIVPTLTDRLRAVAKGDFAPLVREVIKEGRRIAKACINNSKVSDHHAIIPTEEGADMAAMSIAEKRIYMLVVRRFLTCFYPAYEYNEIKAHLTAAGADFGAAGRVVVSKGFKKVYDIHDEAEEEEQTLPSIKKGETYPCKGIQLAAKKTTPPARYTEATLLTAMENPAPFIEDQKMKEFIGGGLGTPATRADIIEKMYSSFYVEKRGVSLVPTSKAMQLIRLVPKDLKEPLLTAKWEKRLDSIKTGNENKDKFIGEIKNYTRDLVKAVGDNSEQYVHDNLTRTPCPVCGKPMLEVTGKKGKMLVCQDRECGHRENLSMITNARCPICHKKLELFGDGEKKTYACRCGFREKADTFHKRLAANAGASKQLVQNYMKKQNKEEEKAPSALALALQKALEEEK